LRLLWVILYIFTNRILGKLTNGRLKRIPGDIGITQLSSHVTRHSFAYYMLSSDASVEEISYAMNHSSIEITQNYLKQTSDVAISRFADEWEI